MRECFFVDIIEQCKDFKLLRTDLISKFKAFLPNLLLIFNACLESLLFYAIVVSPPHDVINV